MKKTHNDGLRVQKNRNANGNGGKRRLKSDITGLLGKLEFIRLARKEIARLDGQYADLKRECARLNRDITRIGHRIMRVLDGAKRRRTPTNMEIRLKGVRRRQFMLALELKAENPMRSMYEISRMVFATIRSDPRNGYPTRQSLHRYMVCMNRKYGCFE